MTAIEWNPGLPVPVGGGQSGQDAEAFVKVAPLRPVHPKGVWSWLTSVDHKRIGIMYGVVAFAFFLIGGLEALLVRLQLAQPEGSVLTASQYNQLFTMHGITMVFMVIMPMSAAFINYMVPLQIGARDVAFPRLNALSFWVFVAGGVLLYTSFFVGGAPDGGWFNYVPNSSVTYSPGTAIDFYVIGLQIAGIASLIGSINLIVTILNMRAPGMTMMRMPIFTWMSLVVQFLLAFSLPIISTALFLLMFDRGYGSHFFDDKAGGDPVLWQHLFWLFGHPEVYILILPAMGMVSEILPVFSRKPLFGYRFVVFSGIGIAFVGFGMWAHHMFASGMGHVALSAFGISTMLIAVPTGVKIVNWIGTMIGGRITFKTPMLFAMGFVAMFTIGGLSGVTHAFVPADTQQTDTYYIVAHFHYVLFGGALFGLFGGIYYWWPKIFGYFLSDRIGKLHFVLMILGLNLTFGPMHVLGLQGQPRRMYRYAEGMGFDVWNLVSTIGAFVIAASVLTFMVNVFLSNRKRVVAPADPWDARTLEWTIPSPVPEYNFYELPEVHSLDDFWHQKYTEDAEGRPVLLESPPALNVAPDEAAARSVHLPSPSLFPVVCSIGILILGYGTVYHWAFIAVGALVLVASLYGWALEPGTEPDEHSHGPDHGAPGDETGSAPTEPTPALVGAPTEDA